MLPRAPFFCTVRRYGRDYVPTMAQRAKERQRGRSERRERSAEGGGRGDSIALTSNTRQPLENLSPRRRRFSAGGSSRGACGSDIYERTAEYTRQNEQR